MVVVTIELWPHGDAEQARPLGVVKIALAAVSPDTKVGSYEVELSHAGRFWGRPGIWKSGFLARHFRDLSPYHLVKAAIEAALQGRKRPPELTPDFSPRSQSQEP